MIAFNAVTIGYRSPLVQIDLPTLERGKTYALIGSNGSGKSTFLKTISSEISPLSGSISMDNKQVHLLSKAEVARKIAFVPARFPEVDFMTVRAFISLGRTPYLSHFGALSEVDNLHIDRVLDKMDLHRLADKFTTELSDGERQLCAVARAIAQQTNVLLLDEPTGYLDYKNKRRLLQTLYELTRDLNLITIFSTHDLETIQLFDFECIGIDLTTKSEASIPILKTVEKNLDLDKIVETFYR